MNQKQILELPEFAKTHTIAEAALHYGVSESTIRYQKERLRIIKGIRVRFISKMGRPSKI